MILETKLQRQVKLSDIFCQKVHFMFHTVADAVLLGAVICDAVDRRRPEQLYGVISRPIQAYYSG